MKNLLLFILILVGGFACKNADSGKSGNLQTHKEAVDTLRLANTSDTLIKFTYLKNAVILDSVDLSGLLIYKDEMGGYSNNFNGFFGMDNYRIEFYWEDVYKDSVDNKLYHVSGKTRFKENIAKFMGEIRIDSVFEFVDPRIDLAEFGYEEVDKKSLKTYEVRGTLTMEENPSETHAGQFSGNFVMDFSHAASGIQDVWYFSPDTPASGGGFISAGVWNLYGDPKTKPYVFGKDFFMFANDILKDFSYGERDVEINQKYLHLGWDQWWENGEWWADGKKAM
jgi:hypothetical protein